MPERYGPMRHVHHLADTIGPRGSTTEGEKAAADYAAREFASYGLAPSVEPFVSTVSGWRPFAVASLIAVACSVSFWFAGPTLAVALGVVMLLVTLSVFAEMYFRPNLLRLFMPRGRSQNVVARVPAASGKPDRRVVLVAHMDTHRTPWIFTSHGRLRFFKLMTTLGVAAFVLSAVLFLVFAFTGADWLRIMALALIPVHLVVFWLTWQPDTTPYTRGANDNASGVAVLLHLAEQLATSPLQDAEVWLLASGCEEVGSVGAQAFIARHREALADASCISIDNVGGAGAGVCYTSVEGMVIPLKPSPGLFALAEEVRTGRPELDAYSLPYTTLHTDATCFMANGIPSLSFVGLTRDGRIPDWHQASDVSDNVDAATVAKTSEFIRLLLNRL